MPAKEGGISTQSHCSRRLALCLDTPLVVLHRLLHACVHTVMRVYMLSTETKEQLLDACANMLKDTSRPSNKKKSREADAHPDFTTDNHKESY